MSQHMMLRRPILEMEASEETRIPIEPDLSPGLSQSMGHREKICIYKAPPDLRRANASAFNPQAVLIGPLQFENRRIARRGERRHVDEETRTRYAMYRKLEGVKSAYIESFKNRIGNKVTAKCRERIQEEVNYIRSCYAELTDSISDDRLVNMVFRDSIFIFEIFIRNYIESDSLVDSVEFRGLVSNIRGDLILLENQLPYDILEILYDSYVEPQLKGPQFRILTLQFFDLNLDDGRKFKHFTDLILQARTDSMHTVKPTKRIEHMYSAKKLHDMGVSFRLADKNESTIVKRRFILPEVRMRSFVADGWTERLLMNIMALEFCHYRNSMYVSSYVELLGFLIGNTKDVDILAECGIIKSRLDQSSVVEMVTRLNQGLQVKSCYHELSESLRSHCLTKWRENLGTIKRQYFPNPLIGAASCLALLLVLLSLTRTVITIVRVS